MSIENLLERLVTANERQALALARIAQANEAAQGVFTSAKAEVEAQREAIPEVEKDVETEPSYAEKRKAEVAAEAKAAKEAEKKPRGRPPKEKVVEPVKAADPVVEDADPFAESEPEPQEEITMDTVRTTLVAVRKFLVAKHGDVKGKEIAYAMLRDHGKGASYLEGSTAAGATPGGPGELKKSNYAAVVKAARALIAAG